MENTLPLLGGTCGHKEGEQRKTALVIGSGPAGLASAWELYRHGFSVTVAERESEFGGALRLISDRRLDKAHLCKVIQDFADCGITFETNTPINLQNIGEIQKSFDYIIVATGTWSSKCLDIEGEKFALNALDYLKTQPTAKKTMVIGGGNVAIDCAVEAVRRGGSAIVCYRKTEQYLKAEQCEIDHAKKVGVEFEFEMIPLEITSEGVHFDKKFIPCEQVVIAVGQFSDLPDGIEKYSNIIVVGDAVTGASSVVQSVLHAKACVRALLKSL